MTKKLENYLYRELEAIEKELRSGNLNEKDTEFYIGQVTFIKIMLKDFGITK